MLLEDLREQVVQVGLEALARGIVHGTAGNMSIRDPEIGAHRHLAERNSVSDRDARRRRRRQ